MIGVRSQALVCRTCQSLIINVHDEKNIVLSPPAGDYLEVRGDVIARYSTQKSTKNMYEFEFMSLYEHQTIELIEFFLFLFLAFFVIYKWPLCVQFMVLSASITITIVIENQVTQYFLLKQKV